jgi:hypothetical protein
MVLYAATIFISAFLLFQVEPMLAKYILPWFGGAPAVWTTCLLFFQILLLGGYAYAYLDDCTDFRIPEFRVEILLHPPYESVFIDVHDYVITARLHAWERNRKQLG